MNNSTVFERNSDSKTKLTHSSENDENKKEHKQEWVWPLVIILSYLHVGAFYGLYLVFTSAKIATTLFAVFLYQITTWGVTAGVHRLWSHRTYKAKWPLRLLLIIMYTTAYTNSVIYWSREHRLHHKYTNTNADPYNSERGFLFSHVLWLVTKRHPDVFEKGKTIDLSDLYSDPFVKYQHKYYTILTVICAVILPTIIPMYFWQETLGNAFYVAMALRFIFTLNLIFLINSAAHMWGNKPYDKNLSAVENTITSVLIAGEAWHNYHHAFPWDYRASELGNYWSNTTTGFINFFAKIGWAYDLKTTSMEIIKQRSQRTGDGSHEIWGWNDKDMPEEEQKAAVVIAAKCS